MLGVIIYFVYRIVFVEGDREVNIQGRYGKIWKNLKFQGFWL